MYKIRNNLAAFEEIKDLKFQKIYYLYRWIISPIRSHSSITFEFINQYKTSSKINYPTFQNIKRDYNNITLNNKTKIEILDNIKYIDENILKIKFQFKNDNNNNNTHEIRIYATKEMFNNLNNDDIEHNIFRWNIQNCSIFW